MRKVSLRTYLAAGYLAAALLPALAFAAPAASQTEVFPPWQHGENNDVVSRGFGFTVPEVDDLAGFPRQSCRCKTRAVRRWKLLLRDGAAGPRV